MKRNEVTIGQLAKRTDVEPSSAHGWFWRDSIPIGKSLEKLCELLQITEAEYTAPVEKRSRGAAA
jgi:hypothetical protein